MNIPRTSSRVTLVTRGGHPLFASVAWHGCVSLATLAFSVPACASLIESMKPLPPPEMAMTREARSLIIARLDPSVRGISPFRWALCVPKRAGRNGKHCLILEAGTQVTREFCSEDYASKREVICAHALASNTPKLRSARALLGEQLRDCRCQLAMP